MEREIFISYSRKDLDKVKAIKEEIEQTTGAECWMDLEGIESGNPSFVKAITNGIMEAKIFLFMLSNTSQSSEYALGEADVARSKNKIMIFVNIDNCVLTPEFRLVYGRSNMIDWNTPSQQNKLLRDLKKLLGIKEETTNIVIEAKRQAEEDERRKSEEKKNGQTTERTKQEEDSGFPAIVSPTLQSSSNRLFIFALGGTGAKVMQSITFLMAMGEFGDTTVFPIFIDFDTQNGNLQRTRELLKDYALTRYPHREDITIKKGEIFSARISDKYINIWSGILNNPTRSHRTINQLINYERLKTEDKLIANLFCSLFPTKRESSLGPTIYTDISLGLKTDKSLSRLAFAVENLTKGETFQNIVGTIQPDDKIAIISSTFGGTGASGVWELLQAFSRFETKPLVCTVLVDPFFTAPQPLGGIINTNQFTTQSQSFNQFVSENDVSNQFTFYHIITDRLLSEQYNEEGNKQVSNATSTELISALAVRRFFMHGQEIQHHVTYSLPRGNGDSYTLDDLLSNGYRDLAIRFTTFAVVSFIIQNGLIKLKHNFDDIENDETYRALERICQAYINWIKELSTREVNGLRLFNFGANDINELVIGRSLVVPSGLFGLLRGGGQLNNSFISCFKKSWSKNKQINTKAGSIKNFIHALSVASTEMAERIMN